MQPEAVLKQFFGYDTFRDNQKLLVMRILAGQDVLGVMPTGAGKSVCYQIPALMRPGLALVISPLISLMRDQVRTLCQAGIPAACLTSAQPVEERTRILRETAQGKYKLLYVAPERLQTPSLQALCQRVRLSLIAVDEAHCVSQWGQDFRPSYLRITEFLQILPERPPVCAFTATATERVRGDIIRLLGLQDPFLLVSGFDRPNLRFFVHHPADKKSALIAELAGRREQSGIVYCLTRKLVDDVYGILHSRGFAAARYHAGLDAETRQTAQEDFLYDRKRIMVATNAFGMGIDKPNVSYVIHYNMPQDLESYYQEAGRAGRDGEMADCILYASESDVRLCRFLIENSRDLSDDLDEEARQTALQRDLDRLRKMRWYCQTTDCLRQTMLHYFGESSPSYCGGCGNCGTHWAWKDVTVDAQKIVSCVFRLNQRGRTVGKRFESSPSYCGGCGNCGTHWAWKDVTVDAQKIVSCVFRLNQRGRTVGKRFLIEILQGQMTERVQQSGLENLSTFGIMRGESVYHIRYILDCLIAQGYLTCRAEERPIVQLSAKSGDIIKKRLPFSVKSPKGVRAVPVHLGDAVGPVWDRSTRVCSRCLSKPVTDWQSVRACRPSRFFPRRYCARCASVCRAR